MQRDAVLSDCGRYRYCLTRRWGPGRAAAFVMLNPSTADHEADDPTIRRCVGFARAWACDALVVVNLYGYRATDPRALWVVMDPIGPVNDRYLIEAAQTAVKEGAPLVAAWGNRARLDRIAAVLALPGMAVVQALGVTRSGQPRHPLYLPATSIPTPWEGTSHG